MKSLHVISIIFVCVYLCHAVTQQQFTINRDGQPIQVDAALIEWQEVEADTFEGTFPFVWDAMNTPQGLAGYIIYTYKDSCSKISANMYPQMKSMNKFMTMNIDSTVSTLGFYAVEKSAKNGDTTVVTEWLIPWDSVSIDASGQYEIGLTGYTQCGDTLNPLILSGRHIIEEGDRVITRGIIWQFITIAILLAVFLILRSRAKRLYKR